MLVYLSNDKGIPWMGIDGQWNHASCDSTLAVLYQSISEIEKKEGEDMKKTLIFIIAIFVLFAGCMSYAYQQSFGLTFDMEDIYGSRELLKPVSLQFSFGIANHGVTIKIIHGEFQYDLDAETYGYPLQKGYMQTDAGAYDVLGLQTYALDDRMYYEEDHSWISGYSDCDLEAEDVKEAEVQYLFTTWVDYEYRTTLKTGLKDQSNDEYAFKKYHTTCKIGTSKSRTSRLEKVKRNNQYDSGLFFHTNQNFGSYARYLDKNNYYFVPPTGKNIGGQNHIYHITVTQHGGKYEAIADLPKDRFYETLMIVKDTLMVFSHDEDAFYISKYDLNGTLMEEAVMDHQYQNSDTLMYKDDRYLFWNTQDRYRVFDTKEMKFVDQYQLKDKIYSLHYANGILYTLEEGSTSGSWYIKAYENQKMLYQGEFKMPVDGLKNTGVIDYGSFIT